MKPANFPGRKDRRRRLALARLVIPYVRPDGTTRLKADVQAEIATLTSRIRADASSMRSKKVAGARRLAA